MTISGLIEASHTRLPDLEATAALSATQRAESLQAVGGHCSGRAQVLRLVLPAAGGWRGSLSPHVNQIHYFQAFASWDGQENSFPNRDAAGTFADVT